MLLAFPPAADYASAADARPFAPTSAFNTVIPTAPAVDPKSGPMIDSAARTGQLHANLVEYGIPIYTAAPDTPRYSVTCDLTGLWGPCPLSDVPVPVPGNAVPNTGEDGVLTVIDPSSNTVSEYWRARRTAQGWAAAFGAVNSLTGSGWGGASTGAGASRVAGVVRVSEIEAGLIPHALVLQSDNVCAGVVRPPALKTDGDSSRPDCIPEGARLQLDPDLDLATLDLSPGERTVARAMQEYGGFLIDRAGTSLSASFERAPDASSTSVGSVYRAAGLGWDYHGMSAVPWDRLRVLSS